MLILWEGGGSFFAGNNAKRQIEELNKKYKEKLRYSMRNERIAEF